MSNFAPLNPNSQTLKLIRVMRVVTEILGKFPPENDRTAQLALLRTYLRRLPIFERLPASALLAAAKGSQLFKFDETTVVTRQGAAEKAVFVVLEGNVHVYV